MYKMVHARPASCEGRSPKRLIVSRVERFNNLSPYRTTVKVSRVKRLVATAPRPRSSIVRDIASCAPHGCAASSRKSMKRQTSRGPATPRVLSDGVGPCVRAGFIVSSRNSSSRVSLCNPVEVE